MSNVTTITRLHRWINCDVENGVRLLASSEHLWRCYWCSLVVTVTGTTDTPDPNGCAHYVDTSEDAE